MTSLQKKESVLLFTLTSFVFFILAFSAAHSVGFVPYYMDGTLSREEQRMLAGIEAESVAKPEVVALADLPKLGELSTVKKVAAPALQEDPIVEPDRVRIDKIKLDVPIINSPSRNAAALDEALKKAPVRYVDSAKLGEDGNMLIFGHSSHLPVVHNQMFKIFNRLPELSMGDTIVVSAGEDEYIYAVILVRKADASDEIIDLSKGQGRRLTLSTCDNFGAKTSRWVVEAEYVGKSE